MEVHTMSLCPLQIYSDETRDLQFSVSVCKSCLNKQKFSEMT